MQSPGAFWNWNQQYHPASNFGNPWPQYLNPAFAPTGPMMARMSLQNQVSSNAAMQNADNTAPPTGVYADPSTQADNRAAGRVESSEQNAGKPKARKSGLKPLPVPRPTSEYDRKSRETPLPVFPSQRLLVVIDLNGTLLHRKNAKASFVGRKHVGRFLAHLLQHHAVMIWSSSKPDNVSKMVAQLFSKDDRAKLAAEWARDTLGLDPVQFAHKVQVYKQLSWVWGSDQVKPHPLAAEGARWDQSNTILIDDSALKAVAEPYNLVELPEFVGGKEQADVLGKALAYIEWISAFHDISAAIRSRKFDARDEHWSWVWEK
jgi:hypothetical protein